jgi:DNA-binding NarL/FixJ family response regulator
VDGREGIRAGAAGFLVKGHRRRRADPGHPGRGRRGGAAVPTVTRRLIAEFAARTRKARILPGLLELTPREREVVALIASGLSNEEISRKIYVSQSTVKTHAARAMTKLGARDRAQLVVYAYQAGLVRPGWAD